MKQKYIELINIETNIHKYPYEISPHQHNHIEIVYYITGQGKVKCDKKTFNFQPNTMLIVPPNIQHSEIGNDKVTLIYVGFQVNDPEIKALLTLGLYKCPLYVHVLKVLKEIEFEAKAGAFFHEEQISALLQSLLILVRRVIKMNEGRTDEMENIKAYIDKNLHKNLNGLKVAEHFNYNYDHFRKTFKQYYNISISEYINRKRVHYAREMLKKTNLSVADIALKCNFSSTSHFISLFKKFYKVTPKQFLLNYDKNVEKK